MARVRAVAQRSELQERLDVELFEALNAEYASHPLVPVPPAYDHDVLVSRSAARVERIHREIDLAEKRVLVFGCGHGYEVWFLGHGLGSDAVGVDIVEHGSWETLSGPRSRFVLAELATERPFPSASFDRVISMNVFEHVTHPRATLRALHDLLAPGGVAWIGANLYRGPRASHRYREVFFPWPHLLFGDDVFRAFYRRRGLPEQPSEWVNRLTWEQYRSEILETGFTIRRERLIEAPFDTAFYDRFEPILNRYPVADLMRDFFEIVLEKPALGRRRRS
jgi:SAM-dependent methyltransferase